MKNLVKKYNHSNFWAVVNSSEEIISGSGKAGKARAIKFAKKIPEKWDNIQHVVDNGVNLRISSFAIDGTDDGTPCYSY